MSSTDGRATGSTPAARAESPWQYPYLSLRPAPNYVPRRDLDQKIKELLQAGNPKIEKEARILVIYGLGGAGKSQLVRHYIREYRQYYAGVFWIEARSKETITRDYVHIYRLLCGHSTSTDQDTKEVEDAVPAVKRWFQIHKGPWLVVFDSADTIDNEHDGSHIDLEYYVPDAPGLHLIITSRSSRAQEITQLKAVEVGEMGWSEAIELFQHQAKISMIGSETFDEIWDIVQELGYLALAITLVGAYVSITPRLQSNLKAFLPEYRQRRKEILQRQPDQYIHQYGESVSNTWEPSFGAIAKSDPVAARLFSLLAFVNFQNISTGLFSDDHEALLDPYMGIISRSEVATSARQPWQSFLSGTQRWAVLNLESSFRTLQNYSLLRKVGQDSYDMPKLVHIWGYYRLEAHEQQQLSRLSLKLVAEATKRRRVGRWYQFGLVPHIMASFTLFSQAYKSPDMIEQDILTAIDDIGHFLYQKGRLSEAYTVWVFHNANAEITLGKEHISTIRSLSNLAEVLQSQSKYEEGERMQRRALALNESVLGREHPDTLMSTNNLGLILQNQGKYNEAEEFLMQTLVLREKILGREHRDTLTSISNLASVLQYQGKFEEAEVLYRQLLASKGWIRDSMDPDMLTSRHNLASVLQHQGKFEEAEILYRQTLASREVMLGMEHPDTLESLRNLVSVLRSQSKYKAMETIYQQTLGFNKLVSGEAHPDTIPANSNLAITLEKQRRAQSEAHQEAYRDVISAYGTASHGPQDGNIASRPRDPDSTTQDTDDARSEYSAISRNSSAILTYMQDFANDLFAAIYTPQTDLKHLQRLCETLKGLLQQFVFRVGYEMQSKEGQEIMYYMHRNRGCVLILAVHHNNQDCSTPAHFDRVSVQRKVSNWVNEEEYDNVLIEEPIMEISEEQDLSYDNPEGPIDRYRTLITKTLAYQWLLSVMRRELTLVVEQEEVLGSIHREINKVLPPVPIFSTRRQPDAVKLLYVLNWSPETFSSGQEYAEEPTVAMERAITLTGALTNAQALPCIQYLRQTWPTNGELILRLMQQLLKSKPGHVVRVNNRRDRSKINAWKTLSTVYVEICGSRSSVVETGEQLAWFGGAMRPSPFGSVALSTPYVDTYELTQEEQDGLEHLDSQDNSTVLKINFAICEEFADPEKDTEGRCWHNLFRNPVVVRGFPILERHSLSLGLEIPLNMMAALIGTVRAHTFDDTTILKGVSSMLVPTKRFDNLTIWHLVFHADGSHVSYTERGLSRLRSTNFAELQASRHIVGWCRRAKGSAGRPEASYGIARSNLKKVGTGCLLEKVSIRLGKYVTAGMNVALAVKDIPVHISRKQYVQKLRQLYSKFFVFWDTEDKRGWLVNGLDALLHLVRATLKHYEKDELMKLVVVLKSEDISEPSKKQAGELDSAYAFNILRDEKNMKLPIYADRDVLESGNADEDGSESSPPLKIQKTFVRLEDRVDELYELLEKIVAHQEEKAGQAGVRIKAHVRKHLEGWQFQDLASDKDPLVPYVEILEAIGKGWVDFVRSIGAITLFGRGFGDLIQPLGKTGCPRWEEVPKQQFYLAARVADLQRIIDSNIVNDTANPIEVCDGISWFSPDSPFDACLCSKGQISKHSDPVQVLWPTKWIGKLPPRNRIPMYPEGAVIFGQNVKFKWIWGDTGEPVKGDPSLETADNPMSDRDDGPMCTEQSSPLDHSPSMMTDTNTPVTSIQSAPEQEHGPDESSHSVKDQIDHDSTGSRKTIQREGINSTNSARPVSKRSGPLRRLRDKLFN